MVAKYLPHLICCRTFVLTSIQPVAEATIKNFHAGDRVKATTISDEIPAANAVVMSNILHDCEKETSSRLMKKSFDALPDGGACVAIEKGHHGIQNIMY